MKVKHDSIKKKQSRNSGGAGKKNFGLMVVALISAVVIGILLAVRLTPTKRHMSAEEYYKLTTDDELAVIVNDVISETHGLLINDAPFVDYETAAEYVSPSVYYETAEELLIVTTPTEKREMSVSGGGTESGEAVIKNGTLYLSLDFLREQTAIEAHYYEDPGRIVIRKNGTFLTAELKKAAPVRWRAGIKSPILRELEAGDEVTVLDVDPDGSENSHKVEGWVFVMSWNGYRGYVQENAVSDMTATEQDLPEPAGEYVTADTGIEGRISLVFHQTTSQAANQALASSIENMTAVNVIAPTWFFLDDTEGSVVSLASESYVRQAHQRNLKVWAVLNDFDGGIASAAETAEVLSHFGSRTKVIETVISEAETSGVDGICLDLELVRQDSTAGYLEFIRELSVECRVRGLVLSVCSYVPTFTKYLNRSEQARVVDFLVTMCYDEHTSGSETAGSVASLPFVEKGISETLEEVPSEKLIAAIPFYTRLWETEGEESPSSSAYGMNGAEALVQELGMTVEYNETAGQNYAELQSGSTLLQIWLEDEISVANKLEVVRRYDCAGVAEWKLGLEKKEIWQVLADGMEIVTETVPETADSESESLPEMTESLSEPVLRESAAELPEEDVAEAPAESAAETESTVSSAEEIPVSGEDEGEVRQGRRSAAALLVPASESSVTA